MERYLERFAASGTTVIRVMLEYAQIRHRHFERPAGVFVPAMVQLWDDFFAMAERRNLRFLITPFDTFWTWLRWGWHPYNRVHGGPLRDPSEFLLCRDPVAAPLLGLDRDRGCASHAVLLLGLDAERGELLRRAAVDLDALTQPGRELEPPLAAPVHVVVQPSFTDVALLPTPTYAVDTCT